MKATREAMVVDPGDDIAGILRVVARHGLRVTMIVVTHAHIDHVGGAHKLKAATGAPVTMSADDLPLYEQLDVQAAWLGMALPERTAIDVAAHEGQKMLVGASEFEVLETPGHTPGSISLWIPTEKKVLVGDTLFRDSIGARTCRGETAGGFCVPFGQTVAACGENRCDPRTWRGHHHWPREGIQLLFAGAIAEQNRARAV